MRSTGARAQIGGEFLVAEDGQSFLQAKLEPVAAGDAVAGPVVEIFVRDDRFDAGEIGVGRGLGRSQHVFVVEDVEPLVLHRAHVEGGDGDDHEDVEIVFAPERLFVPAHGALEAFHRVGAAILLARLDIDVQRDLAPGHGGEAVRDARQVAADQREQDSRALETDRARPRSDARCPARSPWETRLPLESRTGASALSASMRVV